MDIELLDKDGSQARIRFEAVDEALVHLFITELSKNKDVKEASYSKEFGKNESHILFIRMAKGRPVTAVKKVMDDLAGEFKKGGSALSKKKRS
jgi:DNA-directed RNA polymerase subunit L